MKKISIFLALVALVMTLFAITVFADEVNIASDATVTTPTTSWWITGNLDRLIDGKEDTGMHSSCHDRDTTVNFKFASEKTITKIVMKVNGTATTTAQNKENLNANTDYKVTFNGKTVTVNALGKTELVIEVNAVIDEFSIAFYSGWNGDNALIREVEVYEYVAPVVEDATGNNIEDEATITITDGNEYIKGGLGYLVDNDPSTGLSAGDAASWINYHFLYTNNPRAITKVKVVVNSTGTMYMVGSAEGTYVHETMSNLQNIYLRLYDAKGIIYELNNQSTSNAVEVTKDGKTYMEYTFDLGGARYEDVVKVEVATLHNKDTKLGVWEVEIIDFQCQKDEDHIYNDATCSAPATCKFCGATTGEPSGEHTILSANCGQPARCQYCDYTEGEPTGEPHRWVNATYEAPKTCIVCGATEGEPWSDSELSGFVRGPEGDKVTYDDIVGEVELIAGSTGKGDPANVLNGTVANVNDLWGGPTGSQIKITLKNEWEINSVNVILASNWASLKISFYDAGGKLLGELNKGGIQDNTGVMNGNMPEELLINDYTGAVNKIVYDSEKSAVKYIVISNTGDKWGWAPAVMELYLVGRERIPYDGCRTHTFEQVFDPAPTCLEDGTLVNRCTVCGGEESPVVAPALGHDMSEYTIKVPATCITAPILEFACTRCGETTERDPFVQDVTDYGDVFSIVTNGAGANTSSHLALFDNNMNTVLMASGGWFVESEITLDMYYYLTSLTIWVGNGGDAAKTTFSYWDAEKNDWVAIGYKQTPVISGTENKYTYEFPSVVYANRIKIRVDGLNSHYGVAYEAEVSGSIINELAAGHTWVETDIIAPDCDDFGYTEYTCSVCYETKAENFIKYTGHTWVDADCFTPKTCSVCAVTEGDPKAHIVEHVDAVAATCFENGNIEYWYCTACGYAWLDADCTLNTNLKAVVLPMAHGTITHVEAKAATCFEDGNIEYWFCEACGYAWLDADCTLNTNLKAVVLPKAHGTITHVEAKAATCTETGNIEYWYCEVCGYAWLDADCTLNTNLKAVVLPTAHSQTVITETVEPNCTTEGSVTTICSVCGEVISTEVLPVAHNWSDTPEDIVPATCISKGTGQYFCVDCWAYDEERGVVETPINPSNHADMPFNSTWTFATCPDCGAFEFYGEHPAFEGDNDYIFYFMSGNVNICTSDYSFDEYYGYKLISVVDGVYTIELVDHVEYDHTTFLGAVATISFNAREQMYIELVSGETTYKFGADPNAEVLPDVIDNSALNGTYAYYDIGGYVQVMFKFEDGIIYVLEDNMGLGLPESFNYEFNVTQGTIDTGDYDINLMYELGDLYFGRYFYLAPVQEAPELPETDDEIGEQIGTMDVETTDTYGYFDLYSYTAKEAGKYTFFVPAGLGLYSKAQYDDYGPAEADFYENLGGTYASFDLAAGETLEFYVGSLEKADWTLVVFYLANHECSFVEISRVPSTCTTAGSVTYECDCGKTYTEPLALAAHTEVAIPAVLPTPSVQGYTAGTECSVCGAVVKAPVAVNVTVLADTKDPAFRIAAASLSAKENISVNYKVAATEGYNGVYMVFVFNGKEYIVTEYTVEASTGRLAFKFDQTFPQLMADNIEAYAYAKTAEGEYSRNCILEYSVMQYIENQLKKNDAALTTVMSDMLYMGAMTQMKQSYKTDALVTDLIAAKGYTLTPSAFNGIPADVNVQAVTGDRTSGYDWKSGSLAMGAQTQVILKFEAADIEGLVAKLEIAGRTYEYDVAELGKDGNRYVIYFDKVNSYEYNDVITATFEKNGEQVGSTLTYSINTFLQRNYENSKSYGVNDRNLMKALYTYGESILAYFG